MALKGDAILKEKLTDITDIINLINFHVSSGKYQDLHFDGLILSKAYKVLDEKAQKSYISWHLRVIQRNSTLAIVTSLDFFAQSNCYAFLETLGYLETSQICLQFLFWFCTIYRPEQNDLIKPFFLDLYSSGQDTMLKFFTLTNTLKGYRSK